MGDAIPVTVLSGSLGAGKTTLVNHLLRHADRRLAVLVNDVGEVNVDADLIADGTELDVGDGVAELSNGCICCGLQDDLETEVVRLAREREFDHLLVEASGISEPAPIARLFTTDSPAAARYAVDALVTVVDAHLFYESFGAADGERRAEAVRRRGEAADGTRPLSDLLVEQVEYADVLLVNKCDLLDEAALDRVEELLATLQPAARRRRTVRSAVPPEELLGVGLFDAARLGETAGWRRALAADDDGDGRDGHDHDHPHPPAAYGVSSFTYRRRRPFDPARAATVLGSLPASVVRAKGTCWVAGTELRQAYSQAGPSAQVTATGPWVASLPELDRQLYRSNRSDLDWDDEWGDRRTELVFIGTDVDREALVARLDDALLDEAALDDWQAVDVGGRFPTDPDDDPVVLASP